jgi:hypothetical protein
MNHIPQKVQSILLGVALVLAFVLCAPTSGMAAASRNLTVIINPAGVGITIIDQVTGTVTQCGIMANFPNNVAKCVKIGKAIPNTTLPTPPVGLSVYLEQQTSSTGSVQDLPGIWIINNSTGDITYCNAVDQAGTPGGSCKDLGDAPQ